MGRAPSGIAIALFERAERSHRGLEPQHCGDGRRRAIERPVQTTKRDHRRTDRDLREHDDAAEIELSVQDVTSERPEHDHVGGDHDEQAECHRPFAQPRGFVLKLMESRAP